MRSSLVLLLLLLSLLLLILILLLLLLLLLFNELTNRRIISMMKQVLGGSCSPACSVPLLTVLWLACLWHENSYVASGELNIDLFLHKYFSFYFLSEETTCWQRLIAGILVFVVLFCLFFSFLGFVFVFVLSCVTFFFPFSF